MGDAVVCRMCAAKNPERAGFCMACGSPLTPVCASCGATTPARGRFCIACGSALDARAEAGARPKGDPGASAGDERRTVTVLFADVSGFTSVAESLDHETVKAMMERCLTRLGSEVDRFGGRVDKYIGDNVMAVFGAPVAHEDDAARAVRSAFAMHAAMDELNDELLTQFGIELALRIGVNTGEVLAGRIGDGYTVLGDAVNIASRLESAAPVGGILVGERTRRLSFDVVSYRELAPLSVKGKAAGVQAWEALEVRGLGRPEPAQAPSIPLIGRGEELAQLEGIFERVYRDASPHMVTLIGQAGVGKTRLLRELEARLSMRQPPVRVRRGRCLAFGSGVVYWPLVEMLRSECLIDDSDEPATVRAKLAERIGPLIAAGEGEEQVERRLASLARVLGAADADVETATGGEDQQSARESFFGAVRAMLEALANERVVVLAWEDIHWADEGTLDLIEYLSRWLRAPVLQICLARDELLERRPAWSTVRRSVTATFLEPLAPSDARELIKALLVSAPGQIERSEELAERCGGNPLFAEALAQRITEEDSASAAEMPDTVQGLLAARLDSLEPFERHLVAHAAVFGRTFRESALEPVADEAGVELESVLTALREKDILVPGDRAASGGERELAFKHVLLRDAAYEMLPKAARARKHAEAGAFIEERASGSEGAVALIAEHYSRAARFAAQAHVTPTEVAELRARAGAYVEAAGDAAAALYSNQEALGYYQSAAAFIDDDEEGSQRIAEKRGDVALRLGHVDMAIECWEGCLAHHSDLGALDRVAELNRKIGAALAHKGERKNAIEHLQRGINLIKDDAASLTLVRLYEEAAWLYMQVGDNMLAIYASEKALRLAEDLGEARAASRAHGIFGRVFGRIGDAAKARDNLERAVELARESDASETVLALLALGHNLEHAEGDYTSAGDRYAEALQLAERIGDIPAQIELQSALAQLAFHRADWAEVVRATDASAELAEREGLVGKLCLSNILRGRLRWRDGEWEASAMLFASAYELADQAGWSEVAVSALTGLSNTLRDEGDLVGAEQALADGLRVCERAGLMPQSIQINAAMALVRDLAHRPDDAAEAAISAMEISKRIREPAGRAAALEAAGIVGTRPEAVEQLRQARAGWERLGRPLDVARCELLIGRRLREHHSGEAGEVLGRAAALYERLAVPHLVARSRELASS